MHRTSLLKLLAGYDNAHPGERDVTARIQALVESETRCFERDCFAPGHVTASSWIVSWDETQVLLTHHRKLGRWLQLGGHADGESDVLAVALREAREESGMQEFETLGAVTLPFDLDVHRIPARGSEPSHEHHDVRFLFRAKRGQPLVRSLESNDLRWFARGALDTLELDESVLRLCRKAEAWRSAQSGDARAAAGSVG